MDKPETGTHNFHDYRLSLVSILFGLVLTDASIAAFDCIKSTEVQFDSVRKILPSLAQIFLGTSIAISSWFGWHKSIKNSRSKSEKHVKMLSVVDLSMVFLYFGIIATREGRGDQASALPEIIIVLLVLLLYLLYDILSKSHPSEKWKLPWPSALSVLFCIGVLITWLIQTPTKNQSILKIIYIDVYLALIVTWLFRSAKEFQRKRELRVECKAGADRKRANPRGKTAGWQFALWNRVRLEHEMTNYFPFALLVMVIGSVLLLA